MTRCISLLGLALMFTPFAARGQTLPPHWTILPISEGKVIINQCSRAMPAEVAAFWTPSVAQIKIIEQRLPDLLRKSRHKIKLAQSRRQYIGFVSHGKKLIYLNAFPSTGPDPIEHSSWRKSAWTVCDGGDAYWGVEFDPANGTFRDLDFNGVA